MAAIEMTLRHHPAVVLIDVRLGSSINGVEAAQGIRQERPCRVIFPTGSNEIATRPRRHGSGRRVGQANPASAPHWSTPILAGFDWAVNTIKVSSFLMTLIRLLRISAATVDSQSERKAIFFNMKIERKRHSIFH
jgi:hypothetical protein